MDGIKDGIQSNMIIIQVSFSLDLLSIMTPLNRVYHWI